MPLGVRVVVNILICFDFLGSLIPDISVLMLALIGWSAITRAGKEDEFPKKPLGQLPPEPPGLAAAATNHVANGQPVGQTGEGLPPRGPSPAASISKRAESGPITDGTPERYQESRPPSSLDKVPHPERDRRGVDTQKERVPTHMPNNSATAGGKALTQNQTNHNSNARSSMRRDKPRWVKPSEGKLEAVKAAALRESQSSLNMGVPPSPSSPTPEEAAGTQRRPRSRAFAPGSNRASNASQYDNVPGPDGEVMEIIELEKPPSRPSSRPYVGPSLRQGSPTRPPSGGTSVSPFRVPKQNMMQSKPEPRAPLHYPPGITPVYTPYILDSRPEDRLYSQPYAEQIYATTGRGSSNPSPEKTLMNNSYLTHRRPPPNMPPLRVAPAELSSQIDSVNESGYYMRQPTRLVGSPAYPPTELRYEGHRRREGWYGDMETGPPRSPVGLPRSPSFQKAQLSPVHPVQEFNFAPANISDAVHHFRGPYQEHSGRQQLPHPLFGGAHYRQAQEAFAMQESMLLWEGQTETEIEGYTVRVMASKQFCVGLMFLHSVLFIWLFVCLSGKSYQTRIASFRHLYWSKTDWRILLLFFVRKIIINCRCELYNRA